MNQLGHMKNFLARARVYGLVASLGLIAQSSRAAAPAELILQYRAATDPALRSAARAQLLKAGPEAVPALIADMAHNARGRDRMRAMIREIGPAAAPKLLELTADAELAPWAASALFWVVDESSADLAPRLIDCAAKIPAVRRSCLSALVRVSSPKAKKHLPAFITLLASADAETRVYACAAIGRLGRSGRGAASELEKISGDSNSAVRAAAQDALRSVRG